MLSLSPRSSHPRWFLTCLCALGLAVWFGSFAGGQDAKKADAKKDEAKKDTMPLAKDRVKIETDDGVELVADFYPPPPAKGKNAAVVLLVHAIGPLKTGTNGASRRDWEKFPELLQGKGYAVLAFDFRGYGESTKIVKPEKYWRLPQAGFLGPHLPGRNFNVNKPPITIDLSYYNSALELAQLGNDLIAVKKWLHLKNNAQELNSSNVIVVGAEQGAALAVLWIYNEFVVGNRARGFGKYEGDDIGCVVWLSMQPFLSNVRIASPTLETCLGALRDKFPTLVLHGEQDKVRQDFWKQAPKWIKPKDQSDRFKGTGVIEIKGTKLAGTRLLGNDAFGTEKTILDYIEKYKSDSLWREQKLNELPTLFETSKLGLPLR